MSLRGRLIGAAAALTLATLGGAFAAVFVSVNRAQELRLDAALEAHAADEARHLASSPSATLRRGPGLFANDVGPLPHSQALFTGSGEVLLSTPGLADVVARLARERRPSRQHFNLRARGAHLRAMILDLPDGSGRRLLFAIPRSDLDGDEAFLARAMRWIFAVAVGWTVVVATALVRRLTREHQAITEVARRVAAGDFNARVALSVRDREVDQLGKDIDEMIARLQRLVSSQQRFVAHAAHELRLPLTTLLGELSLALRRERDDASYRDTIEQALGDTRRLKILADDLLTLARSSGLPTNEAETLSLAEVTRGAVGLVGALAEARGVRIEVRGDAKARGHEADLQRLVRNLLENAVRFSPPGRAVRVTLREARDGARLTVRDEGAGVPEADRERIFDPFFRAAGHRDHDDLGAGLGLAIAREIVLAHRGEITLDAPEPAAPGASFTVRLPPA